MRKGENRIRKMRACRKEYERIKARIREVGFICKGTLVKQWLPCGNPNCRCHKDKKNLHGPYYYLSWKEKGKTVTRLLPPEKARLYREWIDNRRRLAAIIDQMHAVSGKATHCILITETRKSKVPTKSKVTKRPKR